MGILWANMAAIGCTGLIEICRIFSVPNGYSAL